jgi:DNA replication protein DnaC
MDEYREPRWITFLGPSGTGKTHLARRLWEIANPCFDWSHQAFIHKPVYWPKFVQDLRGGKAFEWRTDMQSWPVLFVDDIAAERDSTGFASDELNTLVGARMGKWTILTANLTIEQISGIDDRIASRIVRDRNMLVRCETKDYAQRPKTPASEAPPRVEQKQDQRTIDEIREKGCAMLRKFVEENV